MLNFLQHPCLGHDSRCVVGRHDLDGQLLVRPVMLGLPGPAGRALTQRLDELIRAAQQLTGGELAGAGAGRSGAGKAEEVSQGVGNRAGLLTRSQVVAQTVRGPFLGGTGK